MRHLCVLASGNGSNLQAIIDACESKYINATVSLVITNKDCFALTRAQKHNITHVKYPDPKKTFEHKTMTMIDACTPKIDWIILAGFMRILSPNFIQHYSGYILNIHPSLLPKYPGLNTHQQVLDNRDTRHGSTVHIVTEKLDAGPILNQAEIKVTSADTLESLQNKIKPLEHQLYCQTLRKLCL